MNQEDASEGEATDQFGYGQIRLGGAARVGASTQGANCRDFGLAEMRIASGQSFSDPRVVFLSITLAGLPMGVPWLAYRV